MTALILVTCAIFQPMVGSNVTAAYGSIKNTTNAEVSVKLKSVETFKAVELHETFNQNGNAGMRRIESAKIAPQATFELKPGGNHIMLFDASRPLKLGESLKASFDVGGKAIPATCVIKERPTGP